MKVMKVSFLRKFRFYVSFAADQKIRKIETLLYGTHYFVPIRHTQHIQTVKFSTARSIKPYNEGIHHMEKVK